MPYRCLIVRDVSDVDAYNTFTDHDTVDTLSWHDMTPIAAATLSQTSNIAITMTNNNAKEI